MAFIACPNCNNNTHESEIFKCMQCNYIFCLYCNNNTLKQAIFSITCPRCSGETRVLGRVENPAVRQKEIDKLKEEQAQATAARQDQQHEANQERLREIQRNIQAAAAQQAQFEEDRLDREAQQRDYANSIFDYKQSLDRLNNINDPVVKVYFVVTKLDSIINDCSFAQQEVNDYQVKKDYAALINYGYSIKNAVNTYQDLTLFYNYNQALNEVTRLKSQHSELVSANNIRSSMTFSMLKSAGISFLAALFLGAFWEGFIGRGFWASTLPWVLFGGLMYYFYKSQDQKTKMDDETLVSTKSALDANLATLNTLESKIAREHPSYFNIRI